MSVYLKAIHTLLVLSVCAGQVYGQESDNSPIDIATIIERMENHDAIRDEALKHGQGSARIVFYSDFEEDEDLDAIVNQLRSKGLPAKKKASVCANVMNVTWYIHDDYLRYDKNISTYADTEGKNYNSCEPEDYLIVSTSSTVSIYYDPRKNHAYVNAAPVHVFDYTGMMAVFDTRLFYDIEKGVSNCNRLRYYERNKTRIARETLDGVDCLHIQYEPGERVLQEGVTRVFTDNLWICPQMGYSIIKWAAEWITLQNGVVSRHVISEYDAEYYQYDTASPLWLLKGMHRLDTRIGHQEMWAEFSGQVVGIDVSQEMFNYEGMGVPRGAVVFDKRRDGPTQVRTYEEGMYVGLDMIQLGDSDEGNEESAKSSITNNTIPVEVNEEIALVGHNRYGDTFRSFFWLLLSGGVLIALFVIVPIIRRVLKGRL